MYVHIDKNAYTFVFHVYKVLFCQKRTDGQLVSFYDIFLNQKSQISYIITSNFHYSITSYTVFSLIEPRGFIFQPLLEGGRLLESGRQIEKIRYLSKETKIHFPVHIMFPNRFLHQKLQIPNSHEHQIFITHRPLLLKQTCT
jgi:hypothetical protein